ncbi:MAG: Nitrate reductase cytochrome c550-type subunit [Candidatus Ruthia sp. Asou_11_S2]|nr:Nitrate reductase cytochrome c550-type subunit [Candidatus Ruthia sp. Asou_11_S2]
MKIKLLIVTIACVFLLSCSGTSDDSVVGHSKNEKQVDIQAFVNAPITSEDIASLRGVHSLRGLSIAPTTNKWIKNGDYERNFDLQPPLVPHKSEYMRITLKSNKCLDCHSNANYREEEAAKMPSSHFKTRSGKRLKKVSSSRYFCKQCHVSQVDTKPLIDNVYINTDE